MKKNFILTLLVCFLAAHAAIAQKTSDKSQFDSKVYDDLVAKAKGGDTAIDYLALRMAFTKTKAYSPYGSDRDDQRAVSTALDQKKYKDAIKKTDEMLKNSFVDMDAHVLASLAYRGLQDNAKADFHKNVYLGLVNSILSSGDGKTAKTAFVVISTREEYVVLRALGLGIGSQALSNQEGHTFDILTVPDPKSKEERKIYFNIDIPWKAETDMFK